MMRGPINLSGLKQAIPLVAGVGVLSLLAGGLWTCRAFPGEAQGPDPAQRQALMAKASTAAAPRLDNWRILGPGGGGAQYMPTVSPHDPNLVLVSCDMTGAYLSKDGGNSWRLFNLVGGRIRFFLFDPLDPDRIYAAAGRALWRSQDRGTSWTLLLPHPPTAKVIYIDDGAGVLVDGPPLWDSPSALAVDPADSNVLYGVFSLTLAISRDAGKTWATLATLSSNGALQMHIDPASPAQQRTIYIVTRTEVCIYENGTASGQGQPYGRPTWIEGTATSFPASGGRPVIYILLSHWFEGDEPVVRGGVLVSRDGGASWTEAHQGLINQLDNKWFLPGFPAIAVPPGAPDTIYLSYSNWKPKGDDNTYGYFGLAHSADGGKTWDFPWQEKFTAAPNVADAWITERFGPSWGAEPLGVGLAPGNPNVIYTTDWGRTMRSTDAGATWTQVYSQKLDDGSFTTTGLDVTACYSVYFDPADITRIFLSCIDVGLFRSDNGGAGWVSSSIGVDREWTNTTYGLAFDPAVPGRMWAAMNGHHELPRLGYLGRKDTHQIKGGIVSSQDGGRKWVKSSGGLPEMAATDILLDPASPVENRTLYAAGFGRGIYKSTDGGANWTLKSNGIVGEKPAAWRVFLDSRGTLYTIVARLSYDGKYGTENDGVLYKSTDGAENWARVPLPEGVNGPQGLAIDPQDPDRLYLAAWCRNDPVFGTSSSGGVYQSSDGGQTWTNSFTANQHIGDVTVDPAQPHILYAAGWASSIWRSTNRGAKWSRLRGYNFKAANRVIPDPRDPKRIFVTTAGGGVWYGPAEGDPSSPEDMLTPLLVQAEAGAPAPLAAKARPKR